MTVGSFLQRKETVVGRRARFNGPHTEARATAHPLAGVSEHGKPQVPKSFLFITAAPAGSGKETVTTADAPPDTPLFRHGGGPHCI